jgi:heat-inducible transcriptional repressor
MPELTDRDKSILNAIIREYVGTGEPVGSRVIAKKYLYTLSSATIRNAMADLEEMGLLYQPHVSAGRTPTPEGFRFYLNDIIEVKALPRLEKSMISRQMSLGTGDIMDTLKKASVLLSKISQNASIIILPRFDTFFFKRIDFVRLDEARIMVVLVSRAGRCTTTSSTARTCLRGNSISSRTTSTRSTRTLPSMRCATGSLKRCPARRQGWIR